MPAEFIASLERNALRFRKGYNGVVRCFLINHDNDLRVRVPPCRHTHRENFDLWIVGTGKCHDRGWVGEAG